MYVLMYNKLPSVDTALRFQGTPETSENSSHKKKNKKNSRKKCVQAAHHHAVAGVCLLTESQQYDALDKHGQSTRHLHTICKDHAKNRTPLKLWSWLIDWRGRLLVITSRVAISDAKLSQSKEQSLHKRHSLLLLNSYIAKSAQHKWTPSVGFNCLAVNSRSSRERAARTVHSPWLTVAVDWSIHDFKTDPAFKSTTANWEHNHIKHDDWILKHICCRLRSTA